MTDEIIKAPELFRRFDAQGIVVRKSGKRTTLTFSLSSEQPVDRWFGTEVLSHEPGAIRLGRAKSGAMPLLFNHNIDAPVGMISNPRVENLRLVVDADMFAIPRAEEVGAMIDGGLHNVSVAYRLHTIEENTKTQQFVATDWEPYEASIVTVPADASVGIGRSASPEYEVRMVRASDMAVPAPTKEQAMSTEGNGQAAGAAPSISVPPTDGAMQERLRITTINALCRQTYGSYKVGDEDRDRWINEAATPDEVSQKILEQIAARTKANPQSPAQVGLTPKETQRYSLWKALRAVADNDWKNAGFELEASRAIAQKLNRVPEATSILIPFEVLQRPVEYRGGSFLTGNYAQRDLSVAAGGGGYLVETSNVGFIDMLRNRSVCMRMGVERLTGLVGNVNIPKQSAAATGYWLAAETTQITESAQTFVQVPLTPRTVGAYTEISRLLLLQSSPGAEGIVTGDLSAVVAIAADLGILAGTGTAQPQGIIGTANLGSLASGTSFDYADILEFQSDVASANVMPVRGGYVTTPVVAALAMARSRFASTDTPLWDGNLWDARMAGFPAMSSMQCPTGDMLFGDWSTVVVGEWGVLEVAVNPAANFQAGIIGIRAMYTMDVAVRHPAAFSLGTSMT